MSIVIEKDNCCINIINHQIHEKAYSVTGHFTALWTLYVTSYLISLPVHSPRHRPMDTAAALEQSKKQEKIGFFKLLSNLYNLLQL